MSRLKEEHEELTETLKLMESAANPKEAATEIAEWCDLHASEDHFSGKSPAFNTWIPDKEQKGKKKLKA